MKKLPLILATLALVVAIGGTYLAISKQTKIGFVDNQALFSQFNGKVELESRLNGVRNQQQSVLDSLKLRIQLSQSTIDNGEAEAAAAVRQEMQLYQRLEREFGTNIASQSQEFTTQIWNQINQYVREFGTQNGYEMIYGAVSDGGVMHGVPELDITEEVLAFINARYEGN